MLLANTYLLNYLLEELSFKLTYQQKKATFGAGKLAIPIKEDDTRSLLFFVCSGLDENDEIPEWAVALNRSDLLIPDVLEVYQQVKGIGHINIEKVNKDWACIIANQDITDADFICVRQTYYEILDISNDAFNPNFDCVRFKNDFIRNARNASYTIIKRPTLYGNVCWVSKAALANHNEITMQLTKTNSDGYGQLNLKFQNACFNKLGFVVHDSAV